MKQILVCVSVLVLFLNGIVTLAQTNPTAQTLPYSQNFGSTTFTALPAGFAGWAFSGATASTQAAAEASAPAANAPALTGQTTAQTGGQIFGYMTAANARPYIQTSSNATNGACQLVLAINTTGLTSITVGYSVEIISAQPRTVGAVMQYRVGTTGAWTTVTGTGNPASQTAGIAGVIATPSLVLPVGAENQAVVQLRWATWRGTQTGNSSGLAIDNISVSGTAPATPTLSGSALAAFGGICTGANATNTFTITGSNLTTAAVEVEALAGYAFSTDNVTFTDSLDLTQPGGAYSQLVYVRFSPTLVQSYNGNIPLNGGGAPAATVATTGSGIVNAAPALSTNTVSAITSSSAILGGNITSLNCSGVTTRGIEWSTTAGFANASGTAVSETGTYGSGAYTMSVTGLPSSTIIYYHAFATNGNGTSYSAESSFITYINITDLTILGFNSNTPDNFAFVPWVDLPAGTQIKFTDNGFLAAASANAASNGRGGENFVTWTNNTGLPITAGTIVTLATAATNVGTAVQGLSGLASGDQIFAYQGTGAGTSASTSDFGTNAGVSTFTGSVLYGINWQGSSGAATWTGAGTSNTSFLPTELNTANANMTFGAAAVGAQYTGPRTGQLTFAGYKALLHNSANWTAVTTGTVTLNTTAFILSAGGPSQIVVTSVNGGANPTTGSAFSVNIETQDGSNVGASVTQDTDVLISIFSGSGALLGTTTGTILDGQSTLTITGVIANTAQIGMVISVSRTSGDVMTAGNSAAFNVLQGATQIAFANVGAWAFTGVIVPFFNVEARRPDNTLDNTYTGNVTIALTSGTGTVLGTMTKPCVAGVATFNDITFDTPGVKQLNATSGAFAVIQSSTFTISTASLTENILPQFIEGNQPSNTNRIPYACFLTLNGLQPSTTYFYSNQAVIASDAATNNGAGNPIFVSGSGFTRTTSPNFSTVGAYGSFTTNSAGSFAGWYVLEPTANATRFASGTDVFMRIALNNGAGGTFTALRITTSSSIRVTSLGSGITNGTGLRGNSSASPLNFVVAYDNTAGIGRPISATFVESDGVANTTAIDYASFYSTSVNGVAGAYGMVIPNNLPNGIRRLEQRFRTTGAITSCPATDTDGIWPSGVNTVNPITGTTAKVITSSDAIFDPFCVPVIPGNNDNFVNATVCQPNGTSYPASRCFNGDLTGSAISPEGNASNVLPGAGQDRWYRIESGATALRITATSAASDLVIELRTFDGTEIAVENEVVGAGQEIMVMGGLISGTTYFVGVRSFDGTVGTFTLCFTQLNSGNVNTSTALPLDGCATFKPTSTGATNYTVSFVPVGLSVGGGTITTTGSFSLGLLSLNLYPGNVYTVTVTSNYVGLVDGAGNVIPTLSLVDASPATLTIANHADIQVRTSYRCDAPATLMKATIVRTDPFVCGVTNYTVRFTPASGCAGTASGLAFERTQASRFISLNFDGSDTSPLNQTIQNQSYYIMEIRPNFGPGGIYPGVFGTGRIIFIGGSVMDSDPSSPIGAAETPQALVTIFPNPGNGQHIMFDHNLNGEGIVQIRLIDVMGREVWKGQQTWMDAGVSELQFDQSLSKGLYMIEIDGTKFHSTHRWIVE